MQLEHLKSPGERLRSRTVRRTSVHGLHSPEENNTGSVVRVPTQLNTVGDHLRKRRLGLKLLQKDVAEQLGVDKTSVFNWEANSSIPETRYMPGIIDFLGTIRCRRRTRWPSSWSDDQLGLGLSQKESARELAVDPSIVAKWERGEREPAGAFLTRVKRFLQDGSALGARRAG